MVYKPPKPDRSKFLETSDELLAAARILYEGTPGMSIRTAAEKVCLSPSVVGRAADSQNWKKNHTKGEVTKAAQEMADKFKSKIADFGPEITTEQKTAVAERMSLDETIDKRAEMLERHRREWAAPRGMSSEAVRIRDTDPIKAFEKAKLAKITAETIKIVQDGERKAWGLDVGELPPGAVVVIERETKQVN